MTDFLHLTGWNTLKINESEHDYHVEAEITTKPPHLCPHCWDFVEFERFGTRRQVVLDAPVRGKRVGILYKVAETTQQEDYGASISTLIEQFEKEIE